MRKIINKNSIQENKELLNTHLNPYLPQLRKNSNQNQQKILELCHLGKFLILFDKKLEIEEVREKPDFILSDGKNKIGIELQIIVESIPKKREGFFNSIARNVEDRLKQDLNFPNLLVNCYLNPNLKFQTNQKKYYSTIIETIIVEYAETGHLKENPLNDKIFAMPHTNKSININLGAWWEKEITADKINSSISKKEKKIKNYKANGIEVQWLLMIIGSTGESSYNMIQDFKFNFHTEFDKIFILEDFYNVLYELK